MYWLLPKNFLDYLEDSTSQVSLIGSTISTRSQMGILCAIRISSPCVLSQDTKKSRVSEGLSKNDFYPKNFNHAFLPKQNFEQYKGNAKKDYQESVAEGVHQDPDHPSSFMKMIKGRENAIATANDKRRQFLPSRVICDGTIDRFEKFRNYSVLI